MKLIADLVAYGVMAPLIALAFAAPIYSIIGLNLYQIKVIIPPKAGK